jgi:hypothetical protein
MAVEPKSRGPREHNDPAAAVAFAERAELTAASSVDPRGARSSSPVAGASGLNKGADDGEGRSRSAPSPREEYLDVVGVEQVDNNVDM